MPIVAAVALGAWLARAPAVDAQTPAPPDALAIFDRTRSTVGARTIPPYIEYVQDAVFLRHGKRRVERARIILRMSDGKANVTPLADDGGDHAVDRPHVEDHPLVYPTTTFGLVRRRFGDEPSAYESRADPAPAPEASPGPPVIGHVTAASRDYDPRLIGTELLDGAPVYHLALVPRRDPAHYPIRELYVDTLSFQPRRIAIEVYAAIGPVRSRPTVTVDFAPVDGVWLIAHATMDFVLRFAFLSYGGSGDLRTSEIRFPASEPDWLFDARSLAAHANASAAPATPAPLSSGAPL